MRCRVRSDFRDHQNEKGYAVVNYRGDGPEIQEDPAFHRRSWTVQRAGWMAMVVLVVAGMLGLLGGEGPFVDNRAGGSEHGIVVEYQKFIRKRSPTDLRIHVLPDAAESSDIAIWIDRAYLERFEVQYINPEPASVATSDTHLIYTFELSEPGQAANLTFNIESESFGMPDAWIGIDGREPVEFRQIIYP